MRCLAIQRRQAHPWCSSMQAHGVRCIAIQGEADLICPPANVWDLHRAWPQMQVRGGGGFTQRTGLGG